MVELLVSCVCIVSQRERVRVSKCVCVCACEHWFVNWLALVVWKAYGVELCPEVCNPRPVCALFGAFAGVIY